MLWFSRNKSNGLLRQGCRLFPLALLPFVGCVLILFPKAKAYASEQIAYSENGRLINEYISNELNDTAAEGSYLRSKRSASIPWIHKLTDAQKDFFRHGWSLYGQSCEPTYHRDFRRFFRKNHNTTETVYSILNGTWKKDGVCDFISENLFCSSVTLQCNCVRGSLFIEAAGKCQYVEGSLDCGKHRYYATHVDNEDLDNRAGLQGSIDCVSGLKCEQDDRLRKEGDTTSQYWICKPEASTDPNKDRFPYTKKMIKELTQFAADKFKWLGRGNSCEMHLNTNSEVTNHIFNKEQTIHEYGATPREAKDRCNTLKNEECHRKGKICVCGPEFALEDGECRLSGSTSLFNDTLRRCEWEMWPSFFVPFKLLELENYVPETMTIPCVNNAECKRNFDDCDMTLPPKSRDPKCYRTCQCEPGKTCAVPKPLKFDNGAINRVPSFSALFIPIILLFI